MGKQVKRPGSNLIIAGLILTVAGVILVNIGERRYTACLDCEDDAEQTIADVAQASAEVEEEQ